MLKWKICFHFFFSFWAAHQENFIDNDLSDVALHAILIGIVPIADFTFDGDLRTLVRILVQQLCIFAPDDEIMPSGISDFLTLLISIDLICGEGYLAYDLATF